MYLTNLRSRLVLVLVQPVKQVQAELEALDLLVSGR